MALFVEAVCASLIDDGEYVIPKFSEMLPNQPDTQEPVATVVMGNDPYA
jgi:hypothetical protein